MLYCASHTTTVCQISTVLPNKTLTHTLHHKLHHTLHHPATHTEITGIRTMGNKMHVFGNRHIFTNVGLFAKNVYVHYLHTCMYHTKSTYASVYACMCVQKWRHFATHPTGHCTAHNATKPETQPTTHPATYTVVHSMPATHRRSLSLCFPLSHSLSLSSSPSLSRSSCT